MALNQETTPILTIAIPTYNRDHYLNRCLNSILIQYHDSLAIEIIVSDNDSKDDTKSVVNKYIEKGLPIKYIKNVQNEGPDYNVGQCYWMAKGKFVLCLGDDDLLVNHAIKKILRIIEEEKNELGVIFLKPRGFKNDFAKEITVTESTRKYIIFYDSYIFLRKIAYYSTFISSNIVNTKFISDKETLLKNKGSYFIHLPSILNAILSSKTNIYVEDFCLAGQLDNSGGYDYFKVFTENIFRIYEDIAGKKWADIIMKKVIQEHLPIYIILFRGKKMENYNKTYSMGSDLLKKFFSFWIFVYPLIYLPFFFAKIYVLGIMMFNKLRRIVRRIVEPLSFKIVYKKL